MIDALETITEAVRQHGANREAYRALGNVRAQVEGEYLILNYTEQAVYDHGWTEIEQMCRGLIFHWPTARLAARPFSKFFNLGEMPQTTLDNLPPEPPEVTVKMDGSLGIGFWYAGVYRIATRGAFNSEQAQWATAFVRRNFASAQFPLHTTLLFEIIYPQNRIVVDYGGEENLYLIGAIEIADGYDHNYASLQQIAAQYGFKLVAQAESMAVPSLVTLAAASRGVEGWVLRYSDGLRVKLKTSEYLELHRLVSGLTTRRIHEAMTDGSLMEMVKKLPEEFRLKAEVVAAAIEAAVAAGDAKLRAAHAAILAALAYAGVGESDQHEYMKQYARLVNTMGLSADERNILFMLAKGREVRLLLLKMIDPSPYEGLLTFGPASEGAA